MVYAAEPFGAMRRSHPKVTRRVRLKMSKEPRPRVHPDQEANPKEKPLDG